MNKKDFSFELVDKEAPDVVLKKALKLIEESTEGYVSGHIQTYDGPIQDYKRKVGIAAALGNLQTSSEILVNIQDSLGELKDEKHRFEVFVLARELKQYKYRMMFLEYGIVSYPVKVVLNDDLATACFGKFKNTFNIESMDELKEMIDVILDSETMLKLVQSLINESLRQKALQGEMIIRDLDINENQE